VLVRRLLPLRQRRSVGAWCFVDHYGPMSVDGGTARSAAGTGRGAAGAARGAAGTAQRAAAAGRGAAWADAASLLTGGRDAAGRIPVMPSHEHAVFVSAGSADVEGTLLQTGQLLYLGTGREQVTIALVSLAPPLGPDRHRVS